MSQPAVTGPFGIIDLRHELGLEPHRVLALGGGHLDERRGCALERLELFGEAGEIAGVEPGADFAGIDQLPVLERTEQQRGERLAPDLGAAVAADHELLALGAFDLEPVSAAARDVRPIGPFRHDAFEPCGAGLVEERLSRPFDVIGIDQKIRDALLCHQFGELGAALLERLFAPVFAVERQQIEHEIADRAVRAVDMLLQRFEVGDARRQHERGLAVDQRAFRREGKQRLGDRREPYCPVETAAAEQRDVVAGLARDDAVAVIFHFVQPAGPGRHLFVERGELRRDEVGD